MEAGSAGRGAARLPAVAWAVLAGFCAAELVRLWLEVPLELLKCCNEGWNAYHAAAAMRGEGLYQGPHSLMPNNYPPLSFYIVGLLGRLTGDNIVAGRIIALVSFMATAGAIAAACRAMGCNWREASFGSLLFMTILLLDSTMGSNDPQMLGHAIAMPALVLVFRGGKTRLYAAAFLLVAAGFVKHSLICLPLAILCWLALLDRRGALRLGACILLLTAAGFLLFRLGFGFSLWPQLNGARQYIVHDAFRGLYGWLLLGGAPLLGTFLLAFRERRDRYALFCAIYVAISVVVGTYFMGGSGVAANVMFDGQIGMAMAGALGINRFGRWPPLKSVPLLRPEILYAVLFVAPLAVGFVVLSKPGWASPAYWLTPARDEVRGSRREVDFVRAQPGAALCEDLAICYWAGKNAPVDLLSFGEQVALGWRTDQALAGPIRAKAYGVIQLDPQGVIVSYPGIAAALRRNYRLDHRSDYGIFLIPANSGGPAR